MKKIWIISIVLVCSLLSVGCGKENTEKSAAQTVSKEQGTQSTQGSSEEKTEDKPVGDYTALLPNPSLDPEKVVEDAYTAEDANFDFKVEYTKDFLDKVNKVCGFLDERYELHGDDQTALDKEGGMHDLVYARRLGIPSEKNVQIIEMLCDLDFNDENSGLYGEQTLILNVHDDSGKIELNGASKAILQNFYPEIDLEAVQEKVNEAVEAGEAAAEASKEDFVSSQEQITLETNEKSCGKIKFSWCKDKDKPVEVGIYFSIRKDYPIQ